MESMFELCVAFTSNLSKWEVFNVFNMDSMFSGCISFDSDLSKWDLSELETVEYMFNGCKALESTDFTNWAKFDAFNIEDDELLDVFREVPHAYFYVGQINPESQENL